MSITLDDRDFSFTYDGSWFLGGQAEFEYDNTTTGTNTAGSMALLNFTGISVSVFGTVGPINYAGQDLLHKEELCFTTTFSLLQHWAMVNTN